MKLTRIDASHPLFEASFTLYEASFPPNERRMRWQFTVWGYGADLNAAAHRRRLSGQQSI